MVLAHLQETFSRIRSRESNNSDNEIKKPSEVILFDPQWLGHLEEAKRTLIYQDLGHAINNQIDYQAQILHALLENYGLSLEGAGKAAYNDALAQIAVTEEEKRSNYIESAIAIRLGTQLMFHPPDAAEVMVQGTKSSYTKDRERAIQTVSDWHSIIFGIPQERKDEMKKIAEHYVSGTDEVKQIKKLQLQYGENAEIETEKVSAHFEAFYAELQTLLLSLQTPSTPEKS